MSRQKSGGCLAIFAMVGSIDSVLNRAIAPYPLYDLPLKAPSILHRVCNMRPHCSKYLYRFVELEKPKRIIFSSVLALWSEAFSKTAPRLVFVNGGVVDIKADKLPGPKGRGLLQSATNIVASKSCRQRPCIAITPNFLEC